MKAVVIDASIVVKWFFPEIFSNEALLIRDTIHNFIVPDLLYTEVGNVLWNRVKTKVLTFAEAQVIIETLFAFPFLLDPVSTKEMLAAALEIACKTGTTVYDSLYLALAIRENTTLVTADRKFYGILQNSILKSSVIWITDCLK